MNRVLLTGRLTRDPEVRTTAGGKAVASFAVATHEYVGGGKEKSEFHNVVAWDRLAETCGRYLGKGQQVALEGRLQTRSWDDDQNKRHWKTEIVASSVEMLSGRRKKDYAAETAATALEAQAVAAGITPDAAEPVADDAGFSVTPGGEDDEEEDELLEEAVAA
ncbi:MAG: single-stranded DNA-binding protein [Chloroflexota bacterium]|nr:single-stranded DNA-binding protein [Chloroflexota bacterium]